MDRQLVINLLRYALLAAMMLTAYRAAKRRHLAEAIAGNEDTAHHAEHQN